MYDTAKVNGNIRIFSYATISLIPNFLFSLFISSPSLSNYITSQRGISICWRTGDFIWHDILFGFGSGGIKSILLLHKAGFHPGKIDSIKDLVEKQGLFSSPPGGIQNHGFRLPGLVRRKGTHKPVGLHMPFHWPARRDSNPRPLESESTAISSFATGGYNGATCILHCFPGICNP